MINGTVAYNKGKESGGIWLAFGATATLQNTILAENTDPLDVPLDVFGVLDWNNSYNNMIGRGGASGFTTAHQNFVLAANESAGLAPLGDYGGLTKTHALLSTSRAIDAGNNQKAIDKGVPLTKILAQFRD